MNCQIKKKLIVGAGINTVIIKNAYPHWLKPVRMRFVLILLMDFRNGEGNIQ